MTPISELIFMKSAAHPAAAADTDAGACRCGVCTEGPGRAARIAETSNAVDNAGPPMTGVEEEKNLAASASGPAGPCCVRNACMEWAIISCEIQM